MKEPPIFGENGAVLNSETMTDEWRTDHDNGKGIEFSEIDWPETVANIAITFGFLVLFPAYAPKGTPIWFSMLAVIGASTLIYLASKAALVGLLWTKNRLFRSRPKEHSREIWPEQ